MIISCNNIREIENINLHDAYIENVIYNHSNKVINVELESEWEKTDYDLSFHEVLYYEMTCCDNGSITLDTSTISHLFKNTTKRGTFT